MVKIPGILLFLFFLSAELSAQKSVIKFNASLFYEDLIRKNIPGFIYVQKGQYPLYVENIYLKGSTSLGAEAGGTFAIYLSTRLSWYSGIHLGYRRLKVTYVNENILYVNPTTSEGSFFIAGINRDLLITQIPVGLTYARWKRIEADISLRNNFIFKVYRHKHSAIKSLNYQLDILSTRKTNNFIPEACVGIGYKMGPWTLKLKYALAIIPFQKKIQNSYNELLPDDIYFSSIFLTAELQTKNLFSFHNK